MRATLRQAGDRQGVPGGDPRPGLRPDAGDARPGRRPRERQHLQARPLRLPGPRAPRPQEHRSRAGRRALPARADAPVEPAATPGSIRCSRCPRRCSTPCLVDYFDRYDPPGKPDYTTLWEHIRECIDLAHRDGSIKTIVSADFPSYVERDEALAETLHKFRSSGKRLFLLTNSAWDYTQRGDELPARRRAASTVLSVAGATTSTSIVVSAGKPEFFTEERPFVELDARGAAARARAPDGPFQRGRVYSGGNIKEFQERARASGDRVLFVGDHIYGDMLRSRKSSNWRTAMVLQELEHEVDDVRSPARRAGAPRPARRRAHPPRLRAERAAGGAARAAEAGATDDARRRRRGGRRQARGQGRDRARCARELRATAAAAPRARGRHRRRVQPVLGPDVPRGLRDQQVRRAGRGLRLRLHEPRLELPLLFADAVLPRPARPHAARALSDRLERRSAAGSGETRRRAPRRGRRTRAAAK